MLHFNSLQLKRFFRKINLVIGLHYAFIFNYKNYRQQLTGLPRHCRAVAYVRTFPAIAFEFDISLHFSACDATPAARDYTNRQFLLFNYRCASCQWQWNNSTIINVLLSFICIKWGRKRFYILNCIKWENCEFNIIDMLWYEKVYFN